MAKPRAASAASPVVTSRAQSRPDTALMGWSWGCSLTLACMGRLASGSAVGTTGQTRTLLGRGGKSLRRDPECDPGCDEELVVPDEVVMGGLSLVGLCGCAVAIDVKDASGGRAKLATPRQH